MCASDDFFFSVSTNGEHMLCVAMATAPKRHRTRKYSPHHTRSNVGFDTYICVHVCMRARQWWHLIFQLSLPHLCKSGISTPYCVKL